MENPWNEIIENYEQYKNEKNFILKNERKIISEFQKRNKNDRYKIHEYILPFPFIGNIANPQIVLLMNNPGFDEIELEKGFYEQFHKEFLNNLKGKSNLHCFDDEYVKYSDYWLIKLKGLIALFDKKSISEKICMINYFPYSSSKFKDFYKSDKTNFLENGYLKSQEYNFEIIKKAMDLNALFVIVRGKKNWFKAIPSLENYKNTHHTNSYLNSAITENNCKNFYDKILEKLKN